MQAHIKKISGYLLLSITIALLEVLLFWIFNTLSGIQYQTATIISFIIALLANWLGSRFVFLQRKHALHKEGMLIILAAIGSILLQLGSVTVVVEFLHSNAVYGKIFGLGVSFFWNYIFRHFIIYPETHA